MQKLLAVIRWTALVAFTAILAYASPLVAGMFVTSMLDSDE